MSDPEWFEMTRHDLAWLDQQLQRVPPRRRDEIRAAHRAHWIKSGDLEPLEHRKNGRGRFEANSRLRIFVENLALREL